MRREKYRSTVWSSAPTRMSTGTPTKFAAIASAYCHSFLYLYTVYLYIICIAHLYNCAP